MTDIFADARPEELEGTYDGGLAWHPVTATKKCGADFKATFDDASFFLDSDGTELTGNYRVRKREQPAPSDEVVERMVALIGGMAALDMTGEGDPVEGDYREARAIYAELEPEPVDPLLIEAREIIADAVAYGAGGVADIARPSAPDFRVGDCDGGDLIQRVVKLAKRGLQITPVQS